MAQQAMGTAIKVRRRRLRLSRRVPPLRRYLALSLLLHVAAIALAIMLVTPPPDQPMPIEVSVIVEGGADTAGQAGGPGSQAQAAPQPAAQQPAAQQPVPQPRVAAPRPNPKPVVLPKKPEPRKVSAPPPAESAPVVEPAAPAPAAPAPTPSMASTSASDAPAASAAAAATGSATGTPGGGQQGSASGSGAGKAAGGGQKGRSANDYLERVRQALAKHKRYPDEARKLKQEGTVRISLHLARDGTVLGVQIAQASGFPLLDEAALQMARDASPVPRIPDDIDGDSVRIALPISYSIGLFGLF